MPRYWIIAPVDSKPTEMFDKVWQFDIANNLISIGWKQLGDISNMSIEELSTAIASTYKDSKQAAQTLYRNMLWNFYHEIAPGDFILARKGTKILAGVGKVVRPAFYAPGKNPDHDYPNFLEVEWQAIPRNKDFPNAIFPIQTVNEASEEQYLRFLKMETVNDSSEETKEEPLNREEFVLEKYLEDFIVSNFKTIFKSELTIYRDAEGKYGQQYQTDIGPIDILSVEPKSKSFVVMELKKGRPSDQVVGQILRYMGWVKENLCANGQAVKGLIICNEPDPRLSYALKMTNNIDARYYEVSFKLSEVPNDKG